jgi:hypothetical protein
VSQQQPEVSLPARRYELAAQLLLQAFEGMPSMRLLPRTETSFAG